MKTTMLSLASTFGVSHHHTTGFRRSKSKRNDNNILTGVGSLCVIWFIIIMMTYAIFMSWNSDLDDNNSSHHYPHTYVISPNSHYNNNNQNNNNDNNLFDFNDKFEGPRWKNSLQTIDKQIYFENKWISLSRHTVKTHITHPNLAQNSQNSQNSQNAQNLQNNIEVQIETKTVNNINNINNNIIDDWFWIDSMNTVNILVTKIIDNIEYFIIFEQTKYGINGPTYSVIGGHIEPNIDQNAQMAARRELLEELGVIIPQNSSSTSSTSSGNLIEFNENEGFRTDVNRGLGFCHTFLARNVVFEDDRLNRMSINEIENEFRMNKNRNIFDETEQLYVKFVELSELIEIYQSGLFKEAKWSNTVGLGILHVLLRDSNVDNNGNKYLLL